MVKGNVKLEYFKYLNEFIFRRQEVANEEFRQKIPGLIINWRLFLKLLDGDYVMIIILNFTDKGVIQCYQIKK